MSMAGEFNELRKVGVAIKVSLSRTFWSFHPVCRFPGESRRVEDDGGHDSEQVISEESRCPIGCQSGAP